MSLSLLILAACSHPGNSPPPTTLTVTKTEQAIPPDELVLECQGVAETTIATTRDLLNDRNAWKDAFCACAASKARLVQWNLSKPNADLINGCATSVPVTATPKN